VGLKTYLRDAIRRPERARHRAYLAVTSEEDRDAAKISEEILDKKVAAAKEVADTEVKSKAEAFTAWAAAVIKDKGDATAKRATATAHARENLAQMIKASSLHILDYQKHERKPSKGSLWDLSGAKRSTVVGFSKDRAEKEIINKAAQKISAWYLKLKIRRLENKIARAKQFSAWHANEMGDLDNAAQKISDWYAKLKNRPREKMMTRAKQISEWYAKLRDNRRKNKSALVIQKAWRTACARRKVFTVAAFAIAVASSAIATATATVATATTAVATTDVSTVIYASPSADSWYADFEDRIEYGEFAVPDSDSDSDSDSYSDSDFMQVDERSPPPYYAVKKIDSEDWDYNDF
jgi:hypothetical protein